MSSTEVSTFSPAVMGFSSLPWLKQIGLLLGLALSISLGIYVAFWSRTSEFLPLYGNLDPKEASQVMEALQNQAVPHKFDAALGGVLVPASQVSELRMKLAAQGLPKRSSGGFELLDETQFGSSQFMESIRYRRSLEGELARTIKGLDAVREARVHLGIPKETSFLRKNTAASASVMVDLYGGHELEPEQILGIVYLVASSVPGLKREDVSVVDQRGRLLTSNGTSSMAVALEQFNYTRQLETVYAKRIQELLGPIVGIQGVRAEVSADLDFTQTEETKEQFDPKKSTLLSEATLVDDRSGTLSAQGIPGALSNEPPQGGTTDPKGNADGQKPEVAASSNQRRQATRNFEVDKSITHTQYGTGKLRRLSIAVVLDDKRTFDKRGKETRAPYTAPELERFNNLVKDAIGFSAERGDTLNIINTSFSQEPPIDVLPPESLLKQPWVIPVIKQALAGIFILIMVFLVLKPLLNNLAKKDPNALPGIEGGLDAAALIAGYQASTGNTAAGAGPGHGNGSAINNQEKLEKIRQMSQEDPKKVAQVVMTWVGKEDE